MERDILACGDIQLADGPGSRRADLVLHLHRLEHQQRLPGHDLIADVDQHSRNQPWNRGFDASIAAGRAGDRRFKVVDLQAVDPAGRFDPPQVAIDHDLAGPVVDQDQLNLPGIVLLLLTTNDERSGPTFVVGLSSFVNLAGGGCPGAIPIVVAQAATVALPACGAHTQPPPPPQGHADRAGTPRP